MIIKNWEFSNSLVTYRENYKSIVNFKEKFLFPLPPFLNTSKFSLNFSFLLGDVRGCRAYRLLEIYLFSTASTISVSYLILLIQESLFQPGFLFPNNARALRSGFFRISANCWSKPTWVILIISFLIWSRMNLLIIVHLAK